MKDFVVCVFVGVLVIACLPLIANVFKFLLFYLMKAVSIVIVLGLIYVVGKLALAISSK